MRGRAARSRWLRRSRAVGRRQGPFEQVSGTSAASGRATARRVAPWPPPAVRARASTCRPPAAPASHRRCRSRHVSINRISSSRPRQGRAASTSTQSSPCKPVSSSRGGGRPLRTVSAREAHLGDHDHALTIEPQAAPPHVFRGNENDQPLELRGGEHRAHCVLEHGLRTQRRILLRQAAAGAQAAAGGRDQSEESGHVGEGTASSEDAKL